MSTGIATIPSELPSSQITIGPAFVDFRATHVPSSAHGQFQADAEYVLSRSAVTPGSVSAKGIVIGYVQSGKTMSYEGIIALARDNGFPIVIVISGIATNLLGQTAGRLEGDLRTEGHEQDWWFITNPSTTDDGATEIVSRLHSQWVTQPIESPRTLVVSLLKNVRHIDAAAEIFGRHSWAGLPILIVDDEADQASLNTRPRQPQRGPSGTYRAILDLIAVFPQSTYLQYTATPQAPLLIDQLDQLSPGFVHVLEPGDGYVGGTTFFSEVTPYVRSIPPADLVQQVGPHDSPPDSLKLALNVFFLGLAAQTASGLRKCRSMLIHPSRETGLHDSYRLWADQIRTNLSLMVDLAKGSPEALAALEEELDGARVDLLRTSPGLPPVAGLLDSLAVVLSDTLVMLVNASRGRTPQINWADGRGFVLVGGQAMDRGFTVEGLTVTYMPRGTGVGNADTIQQRGRFFGYKASYLAYCRLYLAPDVRFAFQAYVEHEESVRSRLLEFERNDLPLDQWRRAFLLDPTLRPTRPNVLLSQGARGDYSSSWYREDRPPYDSEVVDYRRELTDKFLNELTFSSLQSPRGATPAQQHEIAYAAIARCIAYLTSLPTRDQDAAAKVLGLLMQLDHIAQEHPATECAIVKMRPASPTVRAVYSNLRVRALFQGRSGQYPGDAFVVVDDRPTLQIHWIDLQLDTQIVATGVPVIAAKLPVGSVASWYVQQ